MAPLRRTTQLVEPHRNHVILLSRFLQCAKPDPFTRRTVSSGDVPCQKLSKTTIYAVSLNPEDYVWLGRRMLAKRHPLEVVHRKPDNNFEVHLVLLSEEK